MAANSNSRGIASLGKRVVNQIWTANSAHSPALSASALKIRSATYSSQYEKNPDDHVQASVVPDDVIQQQSTNYWAPHPQTGVFGPATDAAAGDRSFHSLSAADAGKEESVLEEKAWFRPTSLEDLEKPHQQP
ncbi:hypothetical protein L6164_035391 [Bauhinia variegata]|uniref:Uncharacterized protein n=1 Tax=Bauhinia variegata TaxID=167791 RepID=A0ACB9KDV2_BAUVA|nr:hypothetical protein L6164_035391 [Bauhinia variegata]